MLEILGSLGWMRTSVHDRCGAIAALLGRWLCVGALVLLRVGSASADEPETPKVAEPSVPSEDPSGPPPKLSAADASWEDRSAESAVDEEASAAPGWSPDVGLGAQVFGVSGKAMVGLSLRIGDELFWGEFEFTPIWLTKSSSDFDGNFVGNQWAFYFSLAPLRTRYVEGLVGVGLDVFHLWGIHSDEAFMALAFKGGIYGRPTKFLSVFMTVRSYALHSGGLELGTTRDRERTIPAVGTLGVEWRFE